MESAVTTSSPSFTSSLNSTSSSDNSNPITNSTGSNGTWYGMNFPFPSLISLLMEYSGIVRSTRQVSEPVNGVAVPVWRPRTQVHPGSGSGSGGGRPCGGESGEVEIRIIGSAEQDNSASSSSRNHVGEVAAGSEDCDGVVSGARGLNLTMDEETRRRVLNEERVPLVPLSDGYENSRDSPTIQRYDIQQAAKWIEQILPFSLLLLVVFIRQHLQGFFVTICISAVMFKSNEFVKRQTALKGDRRVPILVATSFAFTLYVICIYWWYQDDDVIYPLAMLPPNETPTFWHAIFIILVNDVLARQVAMAFKCLLLIYYKNSRGHNFRWQGQMLTVVEYTLLLYRALLPTPVWYRFFLNKDYGSLFSSLITGLYLTLKLTTVVQKVRCFVSALKALSKKEIHYGVYATPEQVNTAGDLCAICQEKMHAPILLRCKHMFCEECVSEWFERERTCPLCRALVKPADQRTFGDGSTNLSYQLC